MSADLVYRTLFHEVTIRDSFRRGLIPEFHGEFFFRSGYLNNEVLQITDSFSTFLDQDTRISSPVRRETFRIDDGNFDCFRIYQQNSAFACYRVLGAVQPKSNQVVICQEREGRVSRHILEKFVKGYQK